MADFEVSPDIFLSDLLRARAAAQPERIAVSQGAESLTFQELDETGETIAGYLLRLGVRPDEPVGIFMDPSVDLMASVWGVLYSGAAYLPLSPEYPDERIRHMVTDARTRIILADEALTGRLAALAPPDTTIVTLAGFDGRDDTVVRGPRSPNSLAYVIYTSGSTGNPKGIAIEHRAITNQMCWLASAQGLTERRVVLQKTPLSFDAAQWEILAPACGAQVVMSEPGAYGDPDQLIELIIDNRVTTVQAVPTLLQALVDTGQLDRCTSLTHVFSGGEALSRSLAVEVLDALPTAQLTNLYGPSECTINTSACTVDRATVHDGPNVVSIGRPVHGIEYHILDADRARVLPGESGELYISGVQLARGYLHRPDLTAQRFCANPFSTDPDHARLYRTGDLASWNDDGTVRFHGRTDNQVKLRGFRVELDEIKASIETHDWVRRAAVVVRDDHRTGANLVAFTELDPTEAALMDQGNHGAHHQSKENKLQRTAQLANLGVREDTGLPFLDLPGTTPTERQRRQVFARKTYRFYEGGDVTRADVLDLLTERLPVPASPREASSLTLTELGGLLRYFGQFPSPERLLPKYGYASPGSLYATQLYLDLAGVAGVEPGLHYYHPVLHRLVLVRPSADAAPRLRVHLVGRRAAIEPVYRNNIQEVLHFEAGHVAGLFDAVLPAFGLRLAGRDRTPDVLADLGCPTDDHHLATFDVVPATDRTDLTGQDDVEWYVQAHPGRIADLAAGQYRYADGQLTRVSDELVAKRHVIAINQEVYQRASFGITLLGRGAEPWSRYVALGRALQRLQHNGVGIGLMSSGYSSETGHDLPAARRIAAILGECDGIATYFAVGGRVSEEQRLAEGMKEDSVHMRGPAEIIRDDLALRLPRYMVPNRVVVLDEFPLTANGKIDLNALRAMDAAAADHSDTPVVPPRTPTEEAIAALWQRVLHRQTVSIRDDFFASGGNSLAAVSLIHRINRELGSALPLQVLFESPTIAELARRVDRVPTRSTSRLVKLHDCPGRPVFCWPGLGGYPMSLRLLASRTPLPGPFYGIQSCGVNAGEDPYATFEEMAAQDVELIRQAQPHGPYTLMGYSFGARLAFEVAHQLESAGEQVESLTLIAPGKPPVESVPNTPSEIPGFTNPTFVSILYSVFAGNLDQPGLDECLAATWDETTFINFVCSRFEHLDAGTVRCVVGVVLRTFRFEYAPEELARRRIAAPVTVLKARGDLDSFIDGAELATATPPTVMRLDADHYGLLRARGVTELVSAIRLSRTQRKAGTVPHISIKHFPYDLDADQRSHLVAAITNAVKSAFSCDDDVVSIAIEPVAQESWNELVYVPEIANARGTLVKAPNY